MVQIQLIIQLHKQRGAIEHDDTGSLLEMRPMQQLLMAHEDMAHSFCWPPELGPLTWANSSRLPSAFSMASLSDLYVFQRYSR